MKLFITSVLAIAFIIIGLSFGAQNDTQVVVNYLIAKDTFSFPLVVAFVLILGFLIGWLSLFTRYSAVRFRYAQLLRQHRKLKKRFDVADH